MAVLLLAAGGLVYVQFRTNAQAVKPSPPWVEKVSKPVSDPPVGRGLPVRLKIDRIKVDSQIEYTGVTAAGHMAVPSVIANAGWYKYGPLPGNTGSAVLSGHVNGPQAQPGVFARLTELQAGDIIRIVDMNGNTASFIVQKTQRYPQDAQPDEVFHSTDDSHLNLITCVGEWNKNQHRYAERLVVFADKQRP